MVTSLAINVLDGLFICLIICGNETFLNIFKAFEILLFSRVIHRVFCFPLGKFLFLFFTCSTGASGISVGQCHLGHGKCPILPEEVGVPFMTQWSWSQVTFPMNWKWRALVFWPVCSQHCLSVVRSHWQSHFELI